MGDKWKTSVKSCGPRHTSVRDKCKIMRPKAPRVGDKCGRQVWETSVDSCSPKNPEWETSVGDKWETSVNSCGPRQPEWDTSVGDKWESSGRQVQTHAAQGTQSGRQVWETSVGDKCGRQVWETSGRQA